MEKTRHGKGQCALAVVVMAKRALLAPHLPGQAGQWGGVTRDVRLLIHAVWWMLRAGALWRDGSARYGD